LHKRINKYEREREREGGREGGRRNLSNLSVKGKV
jgi:hypothetical protein